MDTPEDPTLEPPNLRFLRRLVTTLTATMIIGLIVVIGLLVIRMSRPTLDLPQTIQLPDGATAEAFTQGTDWFAVVTAEEILIYNRKDGQLRQRVMLEKSP